MVINMYEILEFVTSLSKDDFDKFLDIKNWSEILHKSRIDTMELIPVRNDPNSPNANFCINIVFMNLGVSHMLSLKRDSLEIDRKDIVLYQDFRNMDEIEFTLVHGRIFQDKNLLKFYPVDKFLELLKEVIKE